MNKYVKYFNKVQKEFQQKGWDFDKAIGRANPYNIVKNKTTFENFKKRVAKERAYNKEREQIHKEYEKIWTRIRAKGSVKKKKQEKTLRQKLKEMGYSKRSINKIIDMQQMYGYGDKWLMEKRNINNMVSIHAVESLVSEFETEREGKRMRVKGAFSRFAGIPRIAERLQEFREMIYRDKNAIHHTEYVLQRFLNETIPLRYNEFKEKHGRYITPPEQFYVDLMDELLHMYSKYVK